MCLVLAEKFPGTKWPALIGNYWVVTLRTLRPNSSKRFPQIPSLSVRSKVFPILLNWHWMALSCVLVILHHVLAEEFPGTKWPAKIGNDWVDTLWTVRAVVGMSLSGYIPSWSELSKKSSEPNWAKCRVKIFRTELEEQKMIPSIHVFFYWENYGK